MSEGIARLPARPSLEQLQKQAKELFKRYQAGDKEALHRFSAVTTRFETTSAPWSPSLADAQFVLAREYGFADWSKLKEQVTLMRGSGPLFLSAKPPFYTLDWVDQSISVQGLQTDHDWDAVFSVMREHKLTKVSANGMSDDALQRLSGLPLVTHLRVSGARHLTDDGVRHLARMPQLQDLELGGRNSEITDRGLNVLCHLTKLRRFQACWTPGLSDSGVAGLRHCDVLEDVNLLGTPTGDGALQALAGKRHLRRFQSGQALTDRGLALLDQFPMFRAWHGGEVKYGLMAAEAEPNYLLIDGPFTNAGLARLRRLEGLFALGLFWHAEAFTSEGLEPLKELPRLGFFGCQNDHCDDQAMRHIAAFPRLRMLMGQGAVASDHGFESLSRSQTIEYFWGRDCPHLTGRGFAALAAMPSLKGLGVSCKNVDDGALATLPQFPALREIVPMDMEDAGFRHLTECKNLEALWCMYCRNTGDAATEHIAGLPGLKSYYAGKTKITDRSIALLGRMGSLEVLEFWQCAAITDAGMGHVAGLPRLREVTCGGLPNVSRQGLGVFPAHVRVNYSE